MGEKGNEMVWPAMSKIKDEEETMATTTESVLNLILLYNLGKTWRKLVKKCNHAFVSGLAQNGELPHASTKPTYEQWTHNVMRFILC